VSKPTKIEAHGHVIKVRDWQGGSGRSDLSLDGFYLVVVKTEERPLLESIAKNLAYALRAPERKKKRPPKPAPV
jgi:hypothetical protein